MARCSKIWRDNRQSIIETSDRHHVAKGVGGPSTFRLDGRAIWLMLLPILLLTSRVTVPLIGAPRVSEQIDEGKAGSRSPDLPTLALP